MTREYGETTVFNQSGFVACEAGAEISIVSPKCLRALPAVAQQRLAAREANPAYSQRDTLPVDAECILLA
ncbi:MAG: hypothetical protein FWH56_03000 [Betaproteobacteria bacterium]|nr:hypothetical protein [Betaproteobacteria bacterium]